MTDKKTSYQSLILRLEDWVKASAEQDVVTLMQLMDTGREYLKAASDLGNEEIRMLEDFLFRDLKAFSHAFSENASESIWLQSIKNRFMAVLAELTDQNKLQLFEMNIDVDHKGIYQAGELVAMGELVCCHCNHRHSIDFVEEILPCVECGHTRFIHQTQVETEDN